MKKVLHKISLLGVFVLVIGQLQAQIQTPSPSPLGIIRQKVGLTDVEIQYSRPGVKDRVIFGDLLKYGEVWRTGANAATRISFSDDVTLSGQKVAAGEYAIYTIPGKDEWAFILYSDLSLGGNVANYKAENEVFNVKVKPENLPMKIETLTFDIGHVRNSSAVVSLMWENTRISIPMGADYDAKVMAQIDDLMENPMSEVAGLYAGAASYYFNEGKDLNKALDWMTEAVKIEPDAFWNVHTKAQIQAALKDYKGAIKTAELSLAKAKANEGGDFGYIGLNTEAIAKWKTMQ